MQRLDAKIQQVYADAYKEAVRKATPNVVTIGVSSGGETKLFRERNFYYCGFNTIEFKCVGKNRELKPFARKSYPSGFYLKVTELGSRGNGDFGLQQKAYAKVAAWLNSEGYNVYHESRLD